MEDVDVLIIGAGQAGLALGRALSGVSTLLLDAHARIGDSWRRHYDSLTLFTPRRFAALPGMPLGGDPEGYPGKDEIADYLERYAARFTLPVVTNVKVLRLTRVKDRFVANTAQKKYSARSVAVATGPGEPVLMPGAGARVMHASAYKSPQQIARGRVLVVGGGNSAAQIAVELAATHEVSIAMRGELRTIPQRVLGQDYFWWTSPLVSRLRSDRLPGSMFAHARDLVVGNALRRALARGAVQRRCGVMRLEGNAVVFDDARRETFDTVILATGFACNFDWINVTDALDDTGMPTGRGGVCKAPGLYFLGLRNQLTAVSHNIAGAGPTANYIARAMKAYMATLPNEADASARQTL